MKNLIIVIVVIAGLGVGGLYVRKMMKDKEKEDKADVLPPGDEQKAPTPDQPKKSETPTQPAADGDKPAADGDKPAADGDKPAADGDKPAADGDEPAADDADGGAG